MSLLQNTHYRMMVHELKLQCTIQCLNISLYETCRAKNTVIDHNIVQVVNYN